MLTNMSSKHLSGLLEWNLNMKWCKRLKVNFTETCFCFEPLFWPARRNVSHVHRAHLTCLSGKEPIENVWKVEARPKKILEGDWMMQMIKQYESLSGVSPPLSWELERRSNLEKHKFAIQYGCPLHQQWVSITLFISGLVSFIMQHLPVHNIEV